MCILQENATKSTITPIIRRIFIFYTSQGWEAWPAVAQQVPPKEFRTVFSRIFCELPRMPTRTNRHVRVKQKYQCAPPHPLNPQPMPAYQYEHDNLRVENTPATRHNHYARDIRSERPAGYQDARPGEKNPNHLRRRYPT